MNLKAPMAKLPRPTTKEAVDALGDESNHEYKIRHRQIDDQHIGRSTKRFFVTINVQHHRIASERDAPFTYKQYLSDVSMQHNY